LSYCLQRRRQHWPFSDYIVLSVAGRLCSLVLDALTAAHPSWLTEPVRDSAKRSFYRRRAPSAFKQGLNETGFVEGPERYDRI
jgi:hypothetical protein